MKKIQERFKKIIKAAFAIIVIAVFSQSTTYGQDYYTTQPEIRQQQHFGPLQYGRRYFTTVSFVYREDGTRNYMWWHNPQPFGFMDENWNIVIAPQYTRVTSFVNGVALVVSEFGHNFIDTQGNYLLQNHSPRIKWDMGNIALIGTHDSRQAYHIVDIANNFAVSAQRFYDPVLSASYVSARLSATGSDWAVINSAGQIARIIELPLNLYTYTLRHNADINNTYAVRVWEHGGVTEQGSQVAHIDPVSNLPYIREVFFEHEPEHIETTVKLDLYQESARILADHMSLPQHVRSNMPSNAELAHWEEIQPMLYAAGRTPIQIHDIKSGQTYNVVVFSAGNHADVEPATAQDAAIIEAMGGHPNWLVRPVWVTIEGRTFSASTSQTTFYGGIVYDNNFGGWLCIHFYQADTHNNNKDWRDEHREILVQAQNRFLIINAIY
ncbi:MAG: WG repeat-containing protein [Defluviitaleaceae bacterium]|nr:WG repeat-containing protein [Defluviitaleaceae bacterium]